MRQPVDELLGAGQARGLDDLGQRRVGPGGRDVLADGAAEQEIVLQHHADAAPQMVEIDVADVDAVEPDQPSWAGRGCPGSAASPSSCPSRSGPTTPMTWPCSTGRTRGRAPGGRAGVAEGHVLELRCRR